MNYYDQAQLLGIPFGTQKRLMDAYFRITRENYREMVRAAEDAEVMGSLLHHVKGASEGLHLDRLAQLTEYLEREWDRLSPEIRGREIEAFGGHLDKAVQEWEEYERQFSAERPS